MTPKNDLPFTIYPSPLHFVRTLAMPRRFASVVAPTFLLVLALAVAPAHAQQQGAGEPAALRIRAAGDVMLGTDFPSQKHLPPDSAANILSAVAPLLQNADLTFVNLEGPIADRTTSTGKCDPGENCYAFRTPPRYARFLSGAGVDVVSLANNHAADFGREGQRQTIRTLEEHGIAWSGPPGTTATLEAGGRRVGLVAFHTARSGNYLNDHDAAAALVDSLARTVDVTLVSFHGGAEGSDALHVPDTMETFYGEQRGHLRAFARRVVDAGADLVLGHGPHVPRGMEIYRGRLVAYSLGNFATYGRFNLSGPLGLGMVLEAELGPAGRFLGGRLLPTRQLGEGVPVPDRRGEAVRLVRRLSRADFPGGPFTILPGGRLFSRRAVRPLPPLPPTVPALDAPALPSRPAVGAAQ
ncbi:MAG: capsular biosynthesis protein [Bacteroidetes bacterium QH_8_67_23]|nr:MAG: capsular biosynthesis protein [Bacteroidetes bacterium QH_8_67_23]